MSRLIILILLCLSCVAYNSESVAPHVKYSANFDNTKIDQVEDLLDVFTKVNSLEVFRKDKGRMKILSNDEDAFITALYFKGDPVLIVTNVGVPSLLVLTVSNYKKMSVSELERLADEVIKSTEAQLNTTFVKVEPK